MAWIQPDWPAPAEVRALSTRRSGGVSAAPFASLNLGAHVGDSAEAVGRIAAVCGPRPGCRRSPSGYRRSTARACSTWMPERATGGPARTQAFTRRPGRVCAILPRTACRAARGGFGRGGGRGPRRLARARRRRDRGDGAGARRRPRRRSWHGSGRPSAPPISRSAPRSATSCCAAIPRPRRHSRGMRAAGTWPTWPHSRAAGSSASALSGSTAAANALTRPGEVLLVSARRRDRAAGDAHLAESSRRRKTVELPGAIPTY